MSGVLNFNPASREATPFFVICLIFGATTAHYHQRFYDFEPESSHNYEDGHEGTTYPGFKVLDPRRDYFVEWVVDHVGKTFTLNITIRNRGWVAVGLSRDGSMKNADILLAGIKANGEPYAEDQFSDYDRRLYTDARQDWTLMYAEELEDVLHFQISRFLDTCDPHDYPITEDLWHVIWAYGEGDQYDYHFDKRGSFRVYLLDPVLRSHEPHLLKWRISKRTVIEPRLTSYWCSIHKAPHMLEKHHIVEVHPYTWDNLTRTHTHHMILWRCAAPPGMNPRDIFEPLVDFEGEECYFNQNRIIPVMMCRMLVGGFAYGGKPYVIPPSVGLPIGEDYDEYWMLEVHYNNPELLPLPLESGFELFFTNRLRPYDGGALIVQYDVFGLFTIPPVSTNFKVYGMCTSECSHEIISQKGIEIVSVLLHTHYSGRRVKLHHFRDGVELPWIMKDDNYDPSFQQWRNLREPRLILPGDHIIVRCHYDNTWTNGTVFSGFATKDEMCFAGLTLNKRVPYYTCSSQVPENRILNLIGVRGFQWDQSQERLVNGRLLSDISDSIEWTRYLRGKLQGITVFSTQNGSCPRILMPTQTKSTRSNRLTAEIRDEWRRLQGTVIGAHADPTDIINLARGYGRSTIMGEFRGVPKYTPGPYSKAMFPFGSKRYRPDRICGDPYHFYYQRTITNLSKVHEHVHTL